MECLIKKHCKFNIKHQKIFELHFDNIAWRIGTIGESL